MNAKQKAMDFENQDLPLFSGTPVTVRLPEAQPPVQAQGRSLFRCKICLDTGRIQAAGSKRYFCTCPAGQQAQEARAFGLRAVRGT